MTSSRFVPLAVLLMLTASAAWAGPFDDPHVGSLGFSGPNTGDVTAAYWNPAALGLLQGYQAIIAGNLRVTNATVNRAAVDPSTGLPGGTQSFPSAKGHGVEHPFQWPPGPGGFIGVGAGISRRFAIALAAYSPFSQRLSFSDPNRNEPTRYHAVSLDTRHLALTSALAIHVTESLQIGVAPTLLFSYQHMVFDEDTSCRVGSCSAEDPTAATRYDLGTKGTRAPSYMVTGGLHYRRNSIDVGLAYATGSLGNDGVIKDSLQNMQITQLALTQGDPLVQIPSVSGEIAYRLPDIFTLGVTWRATSTITASGIARYLRYGSNDRIAIRVVGPANNGSLGITVPEQITLYRGFQDSWDLRGRLIHAPVPWLRVSGTLRVETSAVPTANVNAAAIDGTTLEPALAAELTLWKRLRLEVGYAFSWMMPVTVNNSIFDPTAAATCAQQAGNLASPACATREAGQARPTAAGDYKMIRHTLAVSTTVSF